MSNPLSKFSGWGEQHSLIVLLLAELGFLMFFGRGRARGGGGE